MMIHVMRDGQQFGPYTLEDVNAYLAQGTLLATDQAWYEGAPDWMLITQVPGVASPGAAPAPEIAAPVAAAVDPMAAANPAVAAADAATVSAANQGGKKKKIMIIAGSAVGVLAIAGVLCFVYPGFLKDDAGEGGGDEGGGNAGGGGGGGGETFAAVVEPILKKSTCYNCHDGQDPEDKANRALNLTKNDSILADVTPGNPGDSELISRLKDAGNSMPPEGKGEMLSADDVAKIEAWIKAGAKF
ncbi:MAG: DUF4339 domain-containing protein [Verrucomicrobia subdivision 3 bacterium]|nr:DUF4339 domain-containing protein [Limisphaerales bacterium]